jgi:hypothetical protein
MEGDFLVEIGVKKVFHFLHKIACRRRLLAVCLLGRLLIHPVRSWHIIFFPYMDPVKKCL